ncbi:twin-arginine translocase subunit TatC [Bacillus massiliigorillae]|uniref:twin-arginine translocase subunit TatC n=1 Tax=Bacillus massiliigorillae TaxID=1243664 RepID=UPI00039A818A|nr:twin-arginine translocase subunit TatC [Bacillus massiliigorillae]
MNDKDLYLTEHLEELRKRIIISVLIFFVALCFGMFFVKDIYLFFTVHLNYKLVVLGPGDIIWIYFRIAAVFAIAVTLPIITHQLWLFIRPALSKKERKVILAYLPSMYILFFLGLAFGYFFIFPNIMHFVTGLGKDLVTFSFTTEKYFSFLLNLTLPFGLAFELPLVMMLLTSIGLINPYEIVKLRKYAYFILIIIACLISPPEFISHISVSIPLIIIFEISIFLAKIVYKSKQLKYVNPTEV